MQFPLFPELDAYERWSEFRPEPEFLEWLAERCPEFCNLEDQLAEYELSGSGDLRAPEIAPVLARIVEIERHALPQWERQREA